ncbi:GNAT family N-acetyltransferase [Vibrio parahaemolyticus]|nr:GNAT family N-acetyltransferase [Vibrio parahaemolyticus]EIU6804037.1 GNAT family N-acetyltransferase [Vibrio parahaemolyticus]
MFRYANESDIPKLVSLLHQTWTKDLFGLIEEESRELFTLDWFTERLKYDLVSFSHTVLVYELNEEICGYLCVRFNNNNSQFEIYSLYVDVGSQSQGVGTMLFYKAMELARTKNSNQMVVWTFLGAPNHQFYERQSPVRKRTRDIKILGMAYSGVGYLYHP